MRPSAYQLNRHLHRSLVGAGDVWASEDFGPIAPPSPHSFDPWDPSPPTPKDPPGTKDAVPPETDPRPRIATKGAVGTEYLPTANANPDFWEPVPGDQKDSNALVSDWSADIGLSEFCPHARENPFELRLVIPSAEHYAQRRARWLVGLLDIPTSKRRRSFLVLFEQLFETYPHSATFAKLADVAIEGALADDLWLAYELRQLWNATPQWWSVRTARLGTPMPATDGPSLMSWKRALQLIACRPGLPAEAIIETDWMFDWYELQYGDPLYWRFVDYATSRGEAYAAGALDMPSPRRGIRASLSLLSIDGLALGHASRTGALVRSLSDNLTFVHSGAEALPEHN